MARHIPHEPGEAEVAVLITDLHQVTAWVWRCSLCQFEKAEADGSRSPVADVLDGNYTLPGLLKRLAPVDIVGIQDGCRWNCNLWQWQRPACP